MKIIVKTREFKKEEYKVLEEICVEDLSTLKIEKRNHVLTVSHDGSYRTYIAYCTQLSFE